MISAIIAFISAIPAITGGITAFTNKYYDTKRDITLARVGGDVNVAKALVSGVVAEGQTRVEFLRVVSQSKFLMFIIGGFAIPIMIFMGKVILWDTILQWGSTLPIKGEVHDWMNTIIYGIFGGAGVMAAGQMFFNRKER